MFRTLQGTIEPEKILLGNVYFCVPLLISAFKFQVMTQVYYSIVVILIIYSSAVLTGTIAICSYGRRRCGWR